MFVPRSQIKNRGFPIVVAAELFRSQIKSVVLVQIHPTDGPVVFPFHFEPVGTGFGDDESRHGEKHEVVVLRNPDPGVSELAIPINEKVFGCPNALPVVGPGNHCVDIVKNAVGLPPVVPSGKKGIGITGGSGRPLEPTGNRVTAFLNRIQRTRRRGQGARRTAPLGTVSGNNRSRLVTVDKARVGRMIGGGRGIGLFAQNRLAHVINSGEAIRPNRTVVSVRFDGIGRRVTPCQSQ